MASTDDRCSGYKEDTLRGVLLDKGRHKGVANTEDEKDAKGGKKRKRAKTRRATCLTRALVDQRTWAEAGGGRDRRRNARREAVNDL